VPSWRIEATTAGLASRKSLVYLVVGEFKFAMGGKQTLTMRLPTLMTLSRHSMLLNTRALVVGLTYTGYSGRRGQSYTEPERF
jgi:hypothetical protein